MENVGGVKKGNGLLEFSKYVGWHIELTRRCPLQCPACPRTYNHHLIPNTKQDINKHDLFNFFPKGQLQDLKYILLCGNLGDPIYHPDFFEIVEYFYPVENLQITTNGMNSDDFWKKALATFPKNVRITLSIDGFEDTNSIYRVNSKWDRIQSLFNLIETEPRQCEIEWKFIVFEHNAHQIDRAKEYSKKIGIDRFRIQKTRPLNEDTNLNGLIKEKQIDEHFKYSTEYLEELYPFCQTMDMHFITAEGNYRPCCWWQDFKEDYVNEHGMWQDIHIRDLNQSTALQHFIKFYNKHLTTDYKCAPESCKLQCSVVKGNNQLGSVPNTQLNRNIIND